MSESPILVTRPDVPDQEMFSRLCSEVFQSRHLTNSGPKLLQFEAEVIRISQAPAAAVSNNGTMALILGLQAMGVGRGSVVATTPFTYIATAQAALWLGAKLIFCDVDPVYLNLCSKSVEALASTECFTHIMGVHCFGNPCDVDGLSSLAARLEIPLFYDAAHTFGASYRGRPLVAYGDGSAVSFHATKTFSCIEGGAFFGPVAAVEKFKRLSNFGYQDGQVVEFLGINAKMNELQAIAGLCSFSGMEQRRLARESLDAMYRLTLQTGLIVPLPRPEGLVSNHPYFPVKVADGQRGRFMEFMNARSIFPRLYFNPLIDEFPAYLGMARPHPVATKASLEIVCLPMCASFSEEEQHRIIAALAAFSRS